MSEQNAESTESEATEGTAGGDTNVEADQVVVNNAPDGGGVDNPAPAESTDSTDSTDSPDSDSE